MLARVLVKVARPLLPVVTLLAMLGAGCARPYDPFRVPREQVRDRIRTIALAPLRVHADLGEPDPARPAIEAAVTERLVAGGFTIVGSDEMGRLWREVARAVGDVFDPITGVAEPKRYKAVEEAVYRELGARHRVDAVLYLQLEVVDVHLPGTTVRYCGVEDPVYWTGGSLLFDPPLLARAACLVVTLYDRDRRQLYAIQSGIEPFETYARQTRAVRPPATRLQDVERIRRAVDQVVGPLAGAPSR